MIYRKATNMPILPVGSSVRISKSFHLYVLGYWYDLENEITSCWLVHWRTLQDAFAKEDWKGFETRFAPLESYSMESLELKVYKPALIAAGFESSGQRMQTAWK